MTRPLSPGDLLDYYRMESLVATNAQSLVFRATDTRTDTPVAVKVPRREITRRWFFKSDLERENGIGRRLDHPSIAKVFPKEPGSRPYAVMEWVDGDTLREIMQEEKTLPVHRAVDIARHICDVLEYIHSRGLVHLDLKPDNIMVHSFDRIKLIDFGIARDRGNRFLAQVRSPRGGTPDYASPEQIAGKSVGLRSDLYSLGVILYEMLTGEVPFSGVEPALALRLRGSVDAPSPRELNSEIGPELDGMICRAIARRPAQRYASALEFSCDLACALDVRPALEFAPSV